MIYDRWSSINWDLYTLGVNIINTPLSQTIPICQSYNVESKWRSLQKIMLYMYLSCY